MKILNNSIGRRNFIQNSAAITTSLIGLTGFNHAARANEFSLAENSFFVIGPMDGYSTQIGTLVSMLNYNRYTIINMVKSMSMKELDYLHDANANTIGALILHLGATEKFYQINTFEGRQDYNDEEKKTWGPAMSLGDEGRQNIKGKDAQYY